MTSWCLNDVMTSWRHIFTRNWYENLSLNKSSFCGRSFSFSLRELRLYSKLVTRIAPSNTMASPCSLAPRSRACLVIRIVGCDVHALKEHTFVTEVQHWYRGMRSYISPGLVIYMPQQDWRLLKEGWYFWTQGPTHLLLGQLEYPCASHMETKQRFTRSRMFNRISIKATKFQPNGSAIL